MTNFSYPTEEARRLIADQGLIARVSAHGSVLCIYDGDEERPGTWMEIDRLAIKDGRILSSALQAVL